MLFELKHGLPKLVAKNADFFSLGVYHVLRTPSFQDVLLDSILLGDIVATHRAT